LKRLKTRLEQDDTFLPDIQGFLAADAVQKPHNDDVFFLDAIDDLVVFMIKHLHRRLDADDLRAELNKKTSAGKSLARSCLELGLPNSVALILSHGAKLFLSDSPETVMKNLDARMIQRPTRWRSIRPEIQQLVYLFAFSIRIEHEKESCWDLKHFLVTSEEFGGGETQIVGVNELLNQDAEWKSLLWDQGYERMAWLHVPSTNVSDSTGLLWHD
jgi:hypothetical protein